MIVASLRVELYLPGVRSLKEKRAIVNKLKQRLKNSYNIAVSEVEHQELLQRCALGMALVSNNNGDIERTFESIHDKISTFFSVQIVSLEKGIY